MNIIDDLQTNRISNSTRNAVVGMANMVAVTVIPFFIRTLMITRLGDEHAGLNSVVVSIFSMLSITELSINNAIVFFLYKPTAEKDLHTIGLYLNALRRVYRFIALVVAIIGVVLLPFLPVILHHEIPTDVNIYVSYGAYLLSVVVSYVFFPEIAALSTACQRSDINSLISLISSLVVYSLQLVSICVFKSLDLYFTSILIQSFVIILLRVITKKRMFAGLDPTGDVSEGLKREIFSMVASMLGHQIDEKLISSIDYVTISFFWGLGLVTLYGNYMYVVTAVALIMGIFFDSMLASIGNALVTESIESNYNRFKAVFWMNGVVAMWATSCMCVMYQRFMKMWMGNRLLGNDTMILFCVMFYVMQIRRTVVMFKNAKGMWKDDRLKPYVAMGANIFLDIIMVRVYGVKGAVISTILCVLFIEIPWETSVLFRHYFHTSIMEYVRKHVFHAMLTVFTSIFVIFGTRYILIKSSIIDLIIRFLMCTIVNAILVFLVYRKSKEMKIWQETFLILIDRSFRNGKKA